MTLQDPDMAPVPAAADPSAMLTAKGRRADPASDEAVEQLHALVMKSLDDDQAVDLVTIPLKGKSAIADHMVIASGRSTRQVASMAAKLAERIKQDLGRLVRIEGLPAADWVLIDADDVVIHLFRPEVRSFYNLERMWAFGDDDARGNASAGAGATKAADEA
jgi:ribosome-associated protein